MEVSSVDMGNMELPFNVSSVPRFRHSRTIGHSLRSAPGCTQLAGERSSVGGRTRNTDGDVDGCGRLRRGRTAIMTGPLTEKCDATWATRWKNLAVCFSGGASAVAERGRVCGVLAGRLTGGLASAPAATAERTAAANRRQKTMAVAVRGKIDARTGGSDATRQQQSQGISCPTWARAHCQWVETARNTSFLTRAAAREDVSGREWSSDGRRWGSAEWQEDEGAVRDGAMSPKEEKKKKKIKKREGRRKEVEKGGLVAGGAGSRRGSSSSGSTSSDGGASDFVKPLSVVYPRVPCRICQGTALPCTVLRCAALCFLIHRVAVAVMSTVCRSYARK